MGTLARYKSSGSGDSQSKRPSNLMKEDSLLSLDIEEDVENNLPKMGTEEESRETRDLTFKNVDAVSI